MGLLTQLLDEHMQAKHNQERFNTGLQANMLGQFISDPTKPADQRNAALKQYMELTPVGKGKQGGLLHGVFSKMLGIHPDQQSQPPQPGAGTGTDSNTDDTGSPITAQPLFKPYQGPTGSGGGGDSSAASGVGGSGQGAGQSASAMPVSPAPQAAQTQSQQTPDPQQSTPAPDDSTSIPALPAYTPVQHPNGQVHALSSPVDSTGKLQLAPPTPTPTPISKRSQPSFTPYAGIPAGLEFNQDKQDEFNQHMAEQQSKLEAMQTRSKSNTGMEIGMQQFQSQMAKAKAVMAQYPDLDPTQVLESVGMPIKGATNVRVIPNTVDKDGNNGTAVIRNGRQIEFLKTQTAETGAQNKDIQLINAWNASDHTDDALPPADVQASMEREAKRQADIQKIKSQGANFDASATLRKAQSNMANKQAEMYGSFVAGTKVGDSPEGMPTGAVGRAIESIFTGMDSRKGLKEGLGSDRLGVNAAFMRAVDDGIKKIDPKFDFNASDAGTKFQSSAFYKRAISAIDSVEPNINKLIELSDQVDRGGTLHLDGMIQGAKAEFNNQKVATFRQAATLVADELGTALGSGAMTDQKLALALHLVKTTTSKEVFKENMDIIKTFLENRRNGFVKGAHYDDSAQLQKFKDSSGQGTGTATSSPQKPVVLPNGVQIRFK